MRRSRMPVRVLIHSSDVSRNVLISSLVMHALGHVDAEGADARTAHEAAAESDHSLASPAAMAAASTMANMSSPRQARSPSTVAFTAALPTGPRK